MSDIPVRNVQRETFNSQLLTGWPKGRRVGGIWGETRSYGDTYHWVLPVCCGVAICSACIFFRRREPGAGDEVAGDISQPGGAEISAQRANAPRLCASGNFGSGYAGLGNMRVIA
jgi:hypothetical protein